MSNNRQSKYLGNARFLELGSPGAPFRSLVNVDHISNVRFEQKISEVEAKFDDDGKMTAPPQQFLEGWTIILVIGHGAGSQNIMFGDEEQAVACYNTILDMIAGVGVPIARIPKLKSEPKPSSIVGANGEALDESPENDDIELPGEAGLTDEEVDALANPEIDVDGFADPYDNEIPKPQ